MTTPLDDRPSPNPAKVGTFLEGTAPADVSSQDERVAA